MMSNLKILFSVEEAISAIVANKLRSLLTTTGIIFGVASVIIMLAISRGSQKQILDQIDSIGAKNIIIEQNKIKQQSYDANMLQFNDIPAINNIVPSVKFISPFKSRTAQVQLQNKFRKITLAGVNSNFFKIFNIKLTEGKGFSATQINKNMPVCIINEKLNRKLNFIADTGRYLKINNVWMKIVGVYKPQQLIKKSELNLKFLNNSNTVYTTLNNFNYRFGQPVKINKKNSHKLTLLNEGNIDKIVLSVISVDQLLQTGKLLQKIIQRRHRNSENIRIIIPLEIFNRHKKSKRIFGIVLGLIAGISLVVGGIGIMNIMLASVYERIKEIGIKKAVGASNNMIIMQFVFEAVIISIIGGILGVFLGVAVSKLISFITGIATIISLNSIFLSFFISVLTGMFFGWKPARKAASQNPVNSLNYE